MANGRTNGGGSTIYKLKIVVPSGATSVRCYRLNDDNSTTELFDGDSLKEGWKLFTTATPSTIKSNYYVVPKFAPFFEVTVGTGGHLENYTWAEIINFANQGIASSLFNVGDTKDFTDKEGNTQTMVIVGFNHDDKADGSGKANISFHSKYLYKDYKQMNTSDTNIGGWAVTAMRTVTMPYIYNSVITNEIVAGIKQVTKSSGSYAPSGPQSTSDYIWIPTCNEVGLNSYGNNTTDNSTTYDYYRDGGNAVRIKSIRGSSSTTWWLRSATSNSHYNFGLVYSNGVGGLYGASTSYGVAFGFCF